MSIFKPMTYKLEYQIGDIVYLITDDEQLPRMVTGAVIRPNGSIVYYLSIGATTETLHYSIEIASDRDLLKALN
jgi:hypothetical protein